MKTFARFLARRFIAGWDRPEDLKVRARYGQLEGGLSVVVNVLLFGVKLTLGVLLNSVSLIADAVHTISDSATSVVIIVGMRAASRPSDRKHPYGHARMEAVTALVVAVLLFVGGIELLIHGVRSLLAPSVGTVHPLAVGIVASTVLVKELLARLAYALGDLIDSQALRADAMHHRSDAYSTVLVVFALIGAQLGFPLADGIAGIAVAFFVLWSAWEVARDSVNPLLGAAPSETLLVEVQEAARVSSEILGIHDIVVHTYGEERFVSLHLEVPATLSGMEMHDMAEEAEAAVVEKVGGHCTIHMDPLNLDHPNYQPVAEAIAEIVVGEPCIEAFHDLRMMGHDRYSKAVFDVVLCPDCDDLERKDALAHLKRRFKERFPKLLLAVNVEPRYAYTVQGGGTTVPGVDAPE
jgi:cation diffusion facilitator family transporter